MAVTFGGYVIEQFERACRGIGAAIMLLATSPSSASETSGTITGMEIMDSGTVIVFVNGTRVGTTPPCGAAMTTRYAFNSSSSTPAGQAKLAALLTAQSGRSLVTIHGKASCTAWADTEDADWIHVQP